MKFFGAPYPIVKHPNGFLHTITGLNTVKADLLVLLLTNPGERVMHPEFGCPLNQYLFEPNDNVSADAIKNVISDAIKTWEPRIAVQNINVSIGSDISSNSVSYSSEIGGKENAVLISITYSDFDNIDQVEQLELEIPLAGE